MQRITGQDDAQKNQEQEAKERADFDSAMAQVIRNQLSDAGRKDCKIFIDELNHLIKADKKRFIAEVRNIIRDIDTEIKRIDTYNELNAQEGDYSKKQQIIEQVGIAGNLFTFKEALERNLKKISPDVTMASSASTAAISSTLATRTLSATEPQAATVTPLELFEQLQKLPAINMVKRNELEELGNIWRESVKSTDDDDEPIRDMNIFKKNLKEKTNFSKQQRQVICTYIEEWEKLGEMNKQLYNEFLASWTKSINLPRRAQNKEDKDTGVADYLPFLIEIFSEHPAYYEKWLKKMEECCMLAGDVGAHSEVGLYMRVLTDALQAKVNPEKFAPKSAKEAAELNKEYQTTIKPCADEFRSTWYNWPTTCMNRLLARYDSTGQTHTDDIQKILSNIAKAKANLGSDISTLQTAMLHIYSAYLSKRDQYNLEYDSTRQSFEEYLNANKSKHSYARTLGLILKEYIQKIPTKYTIEIMDEPLMIGLPKLQKEGARHYFDLDLPRSVIRDVEKEMSAAASAKKTRSATSPEKASATTASTATTSGTIFRKDISVSTSTTVSTSSASNPPNPSKRRSE